MVHFGDWLPETSRGFKLEKEERGRERAPGKRVQLVGDGGLTAGPLLQPAFGRGRLSNACFCLRLISFLVASCKPDPADLENDERAECWGPEGMKGPGRTTGWSYDPGSPAA